MNQKSMMKSTKLSHLREKDKANSIFLNGADNKRR